MAQKSAFVDFHIGLSHGYATVTRMTGRGPVLLVTPENGTGFEAWRSAREDAANCGPLWTPEWLVHSLAHQVGMRACAGRAIRQQRRVVHLSGQVYLWPE